MGMKKAGWKNYGYEICFLFLTAVLGSAGLWQYVTAVKELPEIVEWYDRDGYTFSDRQLLKLSESTRTGFYVQAERVVEDELLHGTEEMTIRWADAEYFKWTGMPLETGRWPQKSREAAVSDTWALEHYKSLHVDGQRVIIGGQGCRISGVYSTGSWRRQLAGDGAPVVYLSFQSDDLPVEYDMHYLYFEKKGRDFQMNRQYLEDTVAVVTGIRVSPDISLDMESVRHVCRQNHVIGILLWLLFTAAVSGGRGRGSKAFRTLLLAVCAAVTVCYQWYVPMDYRTGNVFDFTGYIRQYIKGQNLRHLYQESGYFGNLASIHIWISWGLAGLELAAALYAAAGRLCLQNTGDGKKKRKESTGRFREM